MWSDCILYLLLNFFEWFNEIEMESIYMQKFDILLEWILRELGLRVLKVLSVDRYFRFKFLNNISIGIRLIF